MGLIKVEGQLIHDATVFVAHGGYQIIFNTRDKGLAWVKVCLLYTSGYGEHTRYLWSVLTEKPGS